MNNAQFSELVKNDKAGKSPSGPPGSSSAFKVPSLGSRARSSIPMTPRSIGGRSSSNEFARQLAEHTRETNGEPARKKFKSKAAPRGTKLAAGYQDRASSRSDGYTEETSKEKKLKELEDMVKKEKIDHATFERLREQMGIGGDLSTTHMVKGLDWKLLERNRKGENASQVQQEEGASPAPDVEDELDSVLDKDIQAKPESVAPTEVQSAYQEAETQAVSRDEILRRLKERRSAKLTPVSIPEASLGDKFKKVPAAEKLGKKKFVETINGRSREVLVFKNKDGSTKRKTRWLDPEGATSKPDTAPLGMEVPAEFLAKQKALLEQQAAEDEDADIFAGVADYNPLRDLVSGSEGGADADEGNIRPSAERPPSDEAHGQARNYFSNQDNTEADEVKFNPIANDPTLMAALKRAAALRKSEEDGGKSKGSGIYTEADDDPAEKHKMFLARLKQQERDDAQDMDLGFGESRFGDEDDEDGPIYDGEEEKGEKKRKRGPKKRKGDKDSVADVMNVLEGRKR